MGKLILVDTREKPKAITDILATFDEAGVEHISTKLLFGDYMDYNRPNLVIDRKQNIAELAKNVTRERKRFVAELERAKMAGAHLVILVAQDKFKDRDKWVSVRDVSDLLTWSSQYTEIRGEKVFRVLSELIYKYDISVQFCHGSTAGKKILEILYNGERA